jgi:hypothetical protein
MKLQLSTIGGGDRGMLNELAYTIPDGLRVFDNRTRQFAIEQFAVCGIGTVGEEFFVNDQTGRARRSRWDCQPGQ